MVHSHLPLNRNDKYTQSKQGKIHATKWQEHVITETTKWIVTKSYVHDLTPALPMCKYARIELEVASLEQTDLLT